MNKSNFNQVLTNPALLSQLTTSDLELVVKEYPWFSLAQVLLAKSYSRAGDVRSTQQLAMAATQHANRLWIHDFIRGKEVEEIVPFEEPQLDDNEGAQTTTTTLPSETQSTNHESKPEIETKNLAAQIIDAEEEQSQIQSISRELKQDIPLQIQPQMNENGFDLHSNEEEYEHPVTADQEKDSDGYDELDKHILATAVSSVIFQEVSENEVSPAENSNLNLPSNSIEKTESDDEFIHWLIGESTENIEEVELSNEIKSAESLIDQFIASDPKITPGKVEQYTGVHLAKDSLDDNFEWVTETMAKLYVAQGKTERARKAYKQLMKLHPEKAIYFEQQLKALNSRK